MAEIFYNGKIYVGALSKHEYENVFNDGSDKLWVDYLNEIPDIRKHPVTGTHSFKDGQDVTGLWTVQYQCQCGRKEKHTINHCENVVMVAVPKSTTPPDELDKEVQSLVDMFYEKMAFQSTELRRHEIAKQCAIIHVQGLIDENDSMFKMAELHMDARAIIVLSERLSQLNTLKQKIEAL